MMGSPVSDGEKRRMVDEIDGDEILKKRAKKINGEEDMKRAAEIVLVLSAMGSMRAGKDPTLAEKAMMAEAREKVVALCEELAPKDVLPREAFGVVIEDLGLNRLKDQRLGFRPPRLSIADKMALSKRRMEESKAFAAQPASYPSQRSETGTGVAGENRGTPTHFHVSSSNKAGHIPVSSGSFHSRTQVIHVSSAASVPFPFQPPVGEIQKPLVSSTVPNNIGRGSTATVHPRVDRAHLRRDGRPMGPPSVPHLPASSSANQHAVRTTAVTLQSQTAPLVDSGTKNRGPDHLPVRADSSASVRASQITTQALVGQTPKPGVSQTASGALPSVHHPVQGMHFVHASPVFNFNHHVEISKVVLKLLNPMLHERPAWTPPSRDYMTRPLACQFCKLIINEVDGMLVCDACENGYHLGCLQSYNAKGLPRGEWHCPRCLAISHGKPFPPKYGRVTRNMNLPKVPSSMTEVKPSSEKVESVEEKVNQPNEMTNGNPDFRSLPQAVKDTESSSESNLPHGNVINESDMSSGKKKDDVPNLEKCPSDTTGTAVEASLPTSIGSSSDKPTEQVVKSEVLPSKDGLVFETEPRTPVEPQVIDTSDHLPGPSNQNDVDQETVPNGVELPEHYHRNSNGVIESNNSYDDERHEKDGGREKLLETGGVHDLARESDEALMSGLHNVDWIGHIDRIMDGKKFFQSCRVNGVVYKVQDYALLRSGNGKVMPMKLQAMWEDSQTSSRWLIVHKCYFPDDLPKEVGRPGAPQSNEVYESTHDSNMMAGFIQGPCEVLPFRKFGEETERSNQESQASDKTGPVFIRNWFYDESRRAFCPTAS